MKESKADGIAAYYDNLSRFLDLAHRVGRGGGASQGATHRFLAGTTGEKNLENAAPERLDRLILEAAIAAGLPAEPRVLDAGCGLGGTIFRWRERVGGFYDGLTLSPQQVHRAEAEAVRRGVAECCHFHLRSYHAPVSGSYNAVIAIESLAHSADPTAAIANLATALVPCGLLLIVDDMPDANAEGGMLAAFKTHWRCPVLADAASYRAAIVAAGLKPLREEDLTNRLRPRPLYWLKVLIAVFGLARRVAPTRGLRDVFDAMIGGFLLEALYRMGGMHYRLIVALKPAADNTL
tara:strand:+ start:563 stop:1441 length:879 start_codon:yes stop_codon:yes gene_type:complete